MSKIICDVCGTSYPESATQCPICGCVRPADVNTVHIDVDESAARPNGTYTYVKGGRFSKANVKKRNQGKPIANADPVPKAEKIVEEDNKKNNKGFFIAVAVLLVAIVAVAIYIAVRFLAPGLPDNTATTDTTISATETTVNENTLATIPCEKIAISKPSITFEHAGAAIFLNITTTPADTTDELQFISDDDSVAAVDDEGRVTAVGSGSTTITVVCGSTKAECQIICNFGDEATEPSAPTETTETTEPTTQPVTGDAQIKLNRDDFTLSGKGATWKLYNGDIPADQITWSSDDEKVATIKDGVVTAVGGGYTTVYAEYQGVKVSCIVRCDAPVFDENDNVAVQGAYKLSTEDRKNDVTLGYIGEKFTLQLLDQNNNPVDVVWQISDSSVCSADGNTITALASGIANVSATVDGVTYTCIVRVRG